MINKPTIIAICGSASPNSSNLSILKHLEQSLHSDFNVEIIDDLDKIPHFNTELTNINVPKVVQHFRNKIESASGVIICTPEYVFSIPSRLKNALEWCVSTVIFTDKPTGLITASANGTKGDEELTLIMKTIQAMLSKETTLIIQGVKGKLNTERTIVDITTIQQLELFTIAYKKLIRFLEA